MIDLTEDERAAIAHIEGVAGKALPPLRLIPAMYEKPVATALLKYRHALEALAAQVVAEQTG